MIRYSRYINQEDHVWYDSSNPTGAKPQAPKQLTVSNENNPSAVVNLPSFKSNFSLIAFNTGIDPLT